MLGPELQRPTWQREDGDHWLRLQQAGCGGDRSERSHCCDRWRRSHMLNGATVDCWGSNYRGDLGNGTTTDSSTPVGVSGLSDVIAVTAGEDHTCALLSGGTVDCWGNNLFGQLGDGTFADSPTPVAVSGLSGAIAVTAGGDHTCALLTGGTIDCWGSDFYGQLGDGQVQTFSPTPVAVTGLSGGAIAVTAGDTFSCALITGGAVECWGQNSSGQLGNGTTTDSSTPVGVSGLGSTASVAGRQCLYMCPPCWRDSGLLGQRLPRRTRQWEAWIQLDIARLGDRIELSELTVPFTFMLSGRQGLQSPSI